MNAVSILPEDRITYKNFEQGSPVLIKVFVADENKEPYEKGALINVLHENKALNAKIVSDPIVINGNAEHKNTKSLSLIVEKI